MSEKTLPQNKKIVNTISLEKAQKWARKWKRKEGKYNKHHELSAFLIPKADLQELLKENVDAVRAYIGIDENNVEKLMIVGTKYDHETGIYVDMIKNTTTANETTVEDIYDFTSPCPPNGDPNSPLNIKP